MNTEKYVHHGAEVVVNSEFKGRHKEICLCYSCENFKPDQRDNCRIAQAVYSLDKSYFLVTPVLECPEYEKKTLPSQHLYDYVDEIADMLRAQLQEDQKKWGTTWIERGYEGQDERFKNWLRTKFSGDLSLPSAAIWGEPGVRPDYLKIMGECLICLVREKYLQ